MKINFNRDNITKYLIIGGVAALTLITGVKFSSDAKKNSKPVNTKNDNQYEENTVIYDASGFPGYHLEGDRCVKDIFQAEDTETLYLVEYPDEDGVTYSAPAGYTLEVRDGVVLAVRTIVKKDIKPLEIHEVDGDFVYIAPAGYILDGNKAVKETVEKEEIPATKVLTK